MFLAVLHRASALLVVSPSWRISSGLLNFLWVEAFNAVMYVHNRTLTKALGHMPYEVLYGARPDVLHLHVLGVPCVVVKPNEVLKKLDDRAKVLLCGVQVHRWWPQVLGPKGVCH